MGLDITAYRRITVLEIVENYTEYYEKYDTRDDLALVYDTGDFPGRARPLDIPKGAYAVVQYEDCFGFRAGSYSWYNGWRNDLAQYALGVDAKAIWGCPEDYSDQPFYELIDFADNEGVIGSEAASRLHAAFVAHRDEIAQKAKAHGDADFFMPLYDDWTNAFALAADGGCVKFH